MKLIVTFDLEIDIPVGSLDDNGNVSSRDLEIIKRDLKNKLIYRLDQFGTHGWLDDGDEYKARLLNPRVEIQEVKP